MIGGVNAWALFKSSGYGILLLISVGEDTDRGYEIVVIIFYLKILLVFPIDPLHKTKRFGISTISKNNVESTMQVFNWQDLNE